MSFTITPVRVDGSYTPYESFEAALFQFDHEVDTTEVLAEMQRNGFKPAPHEQGKAYDAALPYRKEPVVVLGEGAEKPAMVLNDFETRYGTEWAYCLEDFHQQWSKDHLFLAVPEKM